MSRRTLTVLVIVVAVLAAWWTLGRQPFPDPGAAMPTTAVSPPTPSPTPSTVTVPPDQPTTEASKSSAPAQQGLSAKERAAVASFATRFMKAFARPSGKVSPRAWWDRVASMLSDDAVDTYRGLTPAQVPFSKVTGPLLLDDVDPAGEAFWIQPVTIGTNAGRWRLLIELPSAGFSTQMRVLEIQEP